MRRRSYAFEFVELMPKVLGEGVLYVSIPYATACHLCFCGCGMRVVTPLSPTDWRLTFNGDTVSLDPSIGNWCYPCRSHYILRANRVIWAGQLLNREVRAIREQEARDKARYYKARLDTPAPDATSPPSAQLKDFLGRTSVPRADEADDEA